MAYPNGGCRRSCPPRVCSGGPQPPRRAAHRRSPLWIQRLRRIRLWNTFRNGEMSGVAQCFILPVCGTSGAIDIEGWAVGPGGGAFGIIGIVSLRSSLPVVHGEGKLCAVGCLIWHPRGPRRQTRQVERTSQAASATRVKMVRTERVAEAARSRITGANTTSF